MMIGPKRHRVSIATRSFGRTDAGDQTEVFATIDSDVPASIDPLRGDEKYQADQVMGKVTHKIRVRFAPAYSALTEKDRITEDGTSPSREFDIVSVINIGERDREFEFICTERR